MKWYHGRFWFCFQGFESSHPSKPRRVYRHIPNVVYGSPLYIKHSLFLNLIMHYFYVLLSKKDGKLYLGFTPNLKRRLKEHNDGKIQSTKPRRPFRLIYNEAHISKEDAQRRENYFKTTKGKSTLKQMLRNSLIMNSKP